MLIGDISSMNADRFPEKIALITGEGDISYRQLEETANRIANVLIGLDIKKGQRVAIIENTSASLIEATLGIVKTGAILVNINNLLGPRELTKVLNDCDPTILIFGKGYGDLVRGVIENLPGIRHYLSLGSSDWAPDLIQPVPRVNQKLLFIPIALFGRIFLPLLSIHINKPTMISGLALYLCTM